MPFTNYLDQKLMQLLFGDAAFTPPGTYYVALFSTAPTQSTAGVELTTSTAPSYARVAVTNNGTNWVAAGSEPSNGYEVVNGTAITFPTTTGLWPSTGSIVAAGIFDASTGGNLLAYATFSGITVQSGATASFAAGALTFTNN